MAKKHRGAFSKEHNKPAPIKQFSELPAAWGPPMGTPQHSADHPIDNLAPRGTGGVLAQSGAPAAGMFDSEHKDGGSTDTGTGKSNY